MKRILGIISQIKEQIDMVESYITGKHEAAIILSNNTDDAAFNFDVEKNCYIIDEYTDPDMIIDKILEMKMGAPEWVEERKEEENLPKLKEGSVSKRKDGRWQGRYYDNGVRKCIYARTQKEVISELNKSIIERNRRDSERAADKNIKLNKWIEQWIKIDKSEFKQSTIIDYQSNLVAKLKKHPLGKKQVSRINAIDIERFIKAIEAPAARARTFRQLKSCFLALEKNRIIKDNPFDLIKTIQEPKGKSYAPTHEELQPFLNYLKSAYYEIYLFCTFISLTGLRKGEALALTWEDIKTDYIIIDKAYELKAKQVQSTKTKSSNRTIPLFAELEPLLVEIKIFSKGKEVFSFIHKHSLDARFRHHRNKFGITKLTIHSLRHYFATQCLEAGIDKKVVQLWLGHSNYKTTSDTYSHVNTPFEKSQVLLLARFREKKV